MEEWGRDVGWKGPSDAVRVCPHLATKNRRPSPARVFSVVAWFNSLVLFARSACFLHNAGLVGQWELVAVRGR